MYSIGLHSEQFEKYKNYIYVPMQINISTNFLLSLFD